MSKKKEVAYKYKDGRFLKISHMGDGEYELILTSKLTADCLFSNEWPLDELLNGRDGVYDDNDNPIEDEFEEDSLTAVDVEIRIK